MDNLNTHSIGSSTRRSTQQRPDPDLSCGLDPVTDDPAGPGEPFGDALDQPQGGGRRAERGGDEARQQRRRHLVPGVGQEARRPDPPDARRQPRSPALARSLDRCRGVSWSLMRLRNNTGDRNDGLFPQLPTA